MANSEHSSKNQVLSDSESQVEYRELTFHFCVGEHVVVCVVTALFWVVFFPQCCLITLILIFSLLVAFVLICTENVQIHCGK